MVEAPTRPPWPHGRRLGSAVVVGPVPGAVWPGVAGHRHLLHGGEAIGILCRVRPGSIGGFLKWGEGSPWTVCVFGIELSFWGLKPVKLWTCGCSMASPVTEIAGFHRKWRVQQEKLDFHIEIWYLVVYPRWLYIPQWSYITVFVWFRPLFVAVLPMFAGVLLMFAAFLPNSCQSNPEFSFSLLKSQMLSRIPIAGAIPKCLKIGPSHYMDDPSESPMDYPINFWK